MKHPKTMALVAGLVFSTAASQAALVNGDFESGDTGFTSAYGYVDPGTSPSYPNGNLYPEGVYTIGSNPNASHNLFYSMSAQSGDKMMIINGAPSIIPVWSSSDTLTAGQKYEFSAWVASVHPDNTAQLAFSAVINNVSTPLGAMNATPEGNWVQYKTTFTAAVSGPTTFSIVDNNTIAHGNDFALDTISVTAVPEPSTYLAGLGSLGMLGLYGWRNRK